MIIAISGKKRSGKDTFASALIEKGYRRLSFADALKDMVSSVYGINRQDLDDQSKKELPLLNYPVSPKDDFCMMIAKNQFREFRGPNGEIPDYVEVVDGLFLAGNKEAPNLFPLYQTPRSLAILLGSVCRSVDPNYWVNTVLNQIKENDNVVIADLRYKSELYKIVEKFPTARIVRIERPGLVSTSTDASECDLDNHSFDFVVTNNSDIESLKRNAEIIASE